MSFQTLFLRWLATTNCFRRVITRQDVQEFRRLTAGFSPRRRTSVICGICGRQTGIGTGLTASTPVYSPCQCTFLPIFPFNQSTVDGSPHTALQNKLDKQKRIKHDNCMRRFREIKKSKNISPIKEQGE